LEELLDQDAVVLVEWGERFPELWPDERVEIELRFLQGEQREIQVTCRGDPDRRAGDASSECYLSIWNRLL